MVTVGHRHADFGNGFAQVEFVPENALLVFGAERFRLIGCGEFQIPGAGGGDFRQGRQKSPGDVAAHEFLGDRLPLLRQIFPRFAAARERFIVGPLGHPQKDQKGNQRQKAEGDHRQRPAIGRERALWTRR